jgi:hypothetical protein
MKYAIINGKKYAVTFGAKFTAFKEIGTIRVRMFKSNMRVSDVSRILKSGR